MAVHIFINVSTDAVFTVTMHISTVFSMASKTENRMKQC